MQEPSYGESERCPAGGEAGPIDGFARRLEPTRPGRVRVLVVDERPVVRIGVCGLLRRAGIDVVGDANGPQEGVTAARETDPDVILMHIDATVTAAADAVRSVARDAPGAKVIVVAAPADAELLGALAAGACGALADDAATDEIVAAIRTTAEGESVFSPSISRALLRRLRLTGDSHIPQLTARELDVLELVARGWDNARIADALYVSTGTVKHHISSILAKLDVENRTQAAVRGVQHGLIGG